MVWEGSEAHGRALNLAFTLRIKADYSVKNLPIDVTVMTQNKKKRAMHDNAIAAAPEETEALIDHILTNYHAMHRADLASRVPLAERVEEVQADDPDDPDAPKGLARVLATLGREMEDHMVKEQTILFPAMRVGGSVGIEHPIAVMRADHDDHAQSIALIRQLAKGLTPPEHACGSWRSLYGGTATLLGELADHIVLENNVLFPRFEPAQ